jgi:hypothetical protein
VDPQAGPCCASAQCMRMPARINTTETLQPELKASLPVVLLMVLLASLLSTTEIAGEQNSRSHVQPHSSSLHKQEGKAEIDPRTKDISPTSTPTCTRVWAVAPSPNLTGTEDSRINALDAWTANDVWAVGQSSTIPQQPLIEHWDGQSWRIVPVPGLDPDTTFINLNSVSAIAPGDVWAVGHWSTGNAGSRSRTLITHWNGNQWSVVPSPNVGTDNNHLKGVVALSPSDVWAVGYYFNGYGGTNILIEHWNGSIWSVIPTPNIGSSESYLNAIAVVSEDDVWAVGSFYDIHNGSGVLALHWDGASWSMIPMPSGLPERSELNGLAVVSATDVWAVGSKRSPEPLIAHWNGGQWSYLSAPSMETVTVLQSVSALSATDLWATGYSGWDMVVLHWNGQSWSTIPNPSGSYGFLNGVAAISANNVLAAGYYNVSYGYNIGHTLVVRWDGTGLGVVPSPNQQVTENILEAVAVASSSEAWTVGSYYDDGLLKTLTQHWDGQRWRIVPSPNGVRLYNVLRGISYIASNDVWAVGEDTLRTLTLHWDGMRWNRVPSPNVPDADNYLYEVAASSSNDVWAVGYEHDHPNGDYKTLTMHWDGSEWRIVPSPNGPGAPGGYLLTVAATSANDVWAAGYYIAGGAYMTLIEHWDGTKWSVVPSPNPSARRATKLNAIAALSSTDAWAVGYYEDSLNNNRKQTLILHWNGSDWDIVPSPNGPGADNALHSVTAINPTDAWAVGIYGAQTLVQHWDGTQWRIVSNANPGTTGNSLNGVHAASSEEVWAVGSAQTRADEQTLIQQYTRPFSDVLPTDYFYTAVHNLYCAGAISGYADNTFRPYNPTTRGQQTKIVVLGFGIPLYTPPTPTFYDVPTTHTFYQYIENAAHE